MSDTQQGPGWWQATDGKWYPPESHPKNQYAPPAPPSAFGYQAQVPGYAGGAPGYQVPAPGYQAPSPVAAPPGYPPWGSSYPPYGQPGAPFVPARQTNGLAVASIACSAAGIVPFFFGVSCVVGIILGFVALSQIKQTGGIQEGRGLAIAGIAVGFSLIAIFVVVLALAFAAGSTGT